MPTELPPCVFVADTTDPYHHTRYCRTCGLPEPHPRHDPDLIPESLRDRASTGDTHE